MIAVAVWTGGVLPSWYHERIERAAACVGRRVGGGAKDGTLYLLWHSGYPWALRQGDNKRVRQKNKTDHQREWQDIQRLATNKGFTAIDLDPLVHGGDVGHIGEVGITMRGLERENLIAMLQHRQYSACKDLLTVAALARKGEEDALCVFDVDFRFDPDVPLVDFLDEQPRLRCNIATQPDGTPSMGHQFILLPAGVSNPWQQSFPTGLTMAENVKVLGVGSYSEVLETAMLEGLQAGGYRGTEPSPLARLHVQIGRFKRTSTDVVCIGTPLADMIATYRYKTDLNLDMDAAREVEREDGIMLRQGQERDAAWRRDIVAHYPPFGTQIDKLAGERRSDAVVSAGSPPTITETSVRTERGDEAQVQC